MSLCGVLFFRLLLDLRLECGSRNGRAAPGEGERSGRLVLHGVVQDVARRGHLRDERPPPRAPAVSPQGPAGARLQVAARHTQQQLEQEKQKHKQMVVSALQSWRRFRWQRRRTSGRGMRARCSSADAGASAIWWQCACGVCVRRTRNYLVTEARAVEMTCGCS